MTSAKENREVKDSVFVDLFYADETAEENDIALYNALHEEPLPEGTKIQKIKVDNILYMNFRNDISFGIGGKVMVFGEHQSTVSGNMPLRCLMYIGRAYEQIVPVRDRYRRKAAQLPKPEFYVFYNGKEEWAKEKILRLSDAYIVKDKKTMLDLEVKLIDIKSERQHGILEKCRVLKEYSQFVEIIEKYQKLGVQDAYKCAIEECIEREILSEYLTRKGSEVRNMLIAEYDYDLDIEVQREEAYEDGLEKGLEQGKKAGVTALIEICKKFGVSKENVFSTIKEKFDLDDEQAEEYLAMYWEK